MSIYRRVAPYTTTEGGQGHIVTWSLGDRRLLEVDFYPPDDGDEVEFRSHYERSVDVAKEAEEIEAFALAVSDLVTIWEQCKAGKLPTDGAVTESREASNLRQQLSMSDAFRKVAIAERDYERFRADRLAIPAGRELPGYGRSALPVALAEQMHDIYEGLAPRFGYVTREDTRQFDPQSPNGQLMTAAVSVLLGHGFVRTVADWIATAPVGVEVARYTLAQAGDQIERVGIGKWRVSVPGIGQTTWTGVGGGIWECTGREDWTSGLMEGSGDAETE